MTIRSIVLLGLAGMLLMSACSSSSSTDEASKGKVNSATTNSPNSNAVAVNTGTEVPRPQVADANAASAASSDELGLASNRTDAKINAMRQQGAQGPTLSAEEVAMRNARPAPENSTFTSYLTDAGYEIRTFNNHPQLLKVERKVTPDGKQSVKIFLRDGRVIERPGDSIPALSTAASAFILQAAGIQVQAPRQKAPSGPAPTKKGE